ncbi:hypothetical protein [Campylobacter corcagiensis]|uniref:Uncharacterized protein n=1 Tax=Campylobacter corcagiensis TaxID=1448857 RepID=A0A6M8N3J3_9BACT|nr:hypothetical protein [Campylobacter corcagiensis]QKF65548.1 hypothetical protein CCORG_a0012 [Campylobacter corcagiensis]QOQ86544.1 hypothetical protein IMC76_00175 [Campylobacter corcagiensis]
MKILKIISISFLMTNLIANPLDPMNFRPLTEQEVLNSQEAQTSDLKIKKFYLDIKDKEIKNIKKKDEELTYLFDDFDETLLNYKPIQKPISTIDRIMTHPYFTTTILLPNGAVISSVDMSVEPITLKYEQNTILLRVKKDFKISNMTIIYSLEKKNYVANFIVEKYDRQKTDEKLNIVFDFQNVKRRDDFEVINLYVKTYGSYPKEDYNYIEIDGITYRIIKDNKFGNLNVGNIKYRVDTGSEI